jgi:hypothetical protein
MHLLQAGVDVTVIALWLGHEGPATTHQYVEADVEMKRRVLGRLDEPPLKATPRSKTDGVLDFLDRLRPNCAELRPITRPGVAALIGRNSA